MSKSNNEFTYKDSVTLKEYFQDVADQMCEVNRVKFEAQDTALSLARESLEKRLETMNEFRQSLKDQQSAFLTRNEYSAKHDLLQGQVDQLRLKGAELSGKADQKSVTIVMIFSLISAMLGVVSLIASFIR
jgi:hypothetical protein